MRIYKVPPDMKVKEKIIGGVLTAAQFGWLLGGVGLGLMLFVMLFPLVGGNVALFLGFLLVPTGLPFAFKKKNQLTLFRYLTLKRKFKKKTKKLPNKRKEVIQ